MKRLLTIFAVGLLAACGSSAPETPVDTEPVYPNVAGTWSDSNAVVTNCGETWRDSYAITFEQSGKELTGTLRWYGEDGKANYEPYQGQISTTGRVTGTIEEAFEATSTVDLRLSDDATILSGEFINQELDPYCADDTDRAKATVRLERE